MFNQASRRIIEVNCTFCLSDNFKVYSPKEALMEIGPIDDMLSDDFNAFSKKVNRLHAQIESRKMMTPSEKHKLEIMLNQIKLFAGITHKDKDQIKEKILYLLKTYYSLFDG